MRISDWSSDVCSSDLIKRNRNADIGLVLVGQRGSRQAATLLVDAFSVRQRTADQHRAMHTRASHLVDAHRDRAIVEQQDITGRDILRHFGVGATNDAGVAKIGSAACRERVWQYV